MLNNLVIIEFLTSFLDSGAYRQPVIQWVLRVLKIVEIQGQCSKNLDLQTLLCKIAPEFRLFSIHKDPTVLLVAYKPLNPRNSSEILREVSMAISFLMVCKKHKKRLLFYFGQISEKSTRNWEQKKYWKKINDCNNTLLH